MSGKSYHKLIFGCFVTIDQESSHQQFFVDLIFGGWVNALVELFSLVCLMFILFLGAKSFNIMTFSIYYTLE